MRKDIESEEPREIDTHVHRRRRRRGRVRINIIRARLSQRSYHAARKSPTWLIGSRREILHLPK